MSVNSKMTAIADEIRELSGTTGTMGLDAMASNVSEVNAEVNSQTELLTQAVLALNGKTSGGGGTTGLSVQADWNQTDETAADFIKNKPVVTVGGYTLEWDGNTEGLVNQLDTFYKVSDSIVSMDDLANGCTVVQGGHTQNYSVDTIMELATGVICTTNSCVWFVAEQGVGVDLGDGLIFTESGVYFMPDVTSLTIPGYTGFAKEQIDPAFLPKPLQFGEEVSDTLIITGEEERIMLNAEYNVLAPYISNAILTKDDLKNGATLTVNRDGEIHECSLTANEIKYNENGIIGFQFKYVGTSTTYNYIITVVPSNNYSDGLFVYPKAGIYALFEQPATFTIPGFGGFGTLTTILDKFIPDTIQRVGDDVILNSSTAGSTKKFKLTVDDSGTITATEVT